MSEGNIFNRKAWLCFFVLLLISVTFSFFDYGKTNLFFSNPYQLLLIEYEDQARHEDWNQIIAAKDDPFLLEFFGDKKKVMDNLSWNSYRNLPAHCFYKIFGFKDVKLWLAYRVYISCLGISVVMLTFLIGNLLYGPIVGLIAGVLIVFSPHVFLHFNVIDPFLRGHNIVFSLLIIYLFLLAERFKNKHFIILAGIFSGMSLSFSFFTGSFMIPLALFIYCAWNAYTIKKIRPYISYFALFLIVAVFSAFILDYLRYLYFNLSESVALGFFKSYFASHKSASHSIYGMVLFDIKRLLLNFKMFFLGVFINGKSLGGHYSIEPPGVPLMYNYVVSFFFLIGYWVSSKKRKKEDIFSLIWFSTFLVFYSFIIVMKLKNICVWIIPPMFILAARSVYPIGEYIHSKFKKLSKNVLVGFISLFIILSSIFSGVFWIFQFLPKKNYYHSISAAGTYKAYEYIAEKGYSKATKIVFTTYNAYFHNMLMRLFTGNVPEVISLTNEFFTFPDFIDAPSVTKEDWLERESNLKKESDRIYYCFVSYTQLPEGWQYKTDDNYRVIFEKIHPELTPFIIYAPSGAVLWRVYEVQ